ncbi:MAG: hypothetical protein IIA54_08610, partial [Chloroflexi bacterium]|nr:hypothetical protein [Chloroflexota bacterium]
MTTTEQKPDQKQATELSPFEKLLELGKDRGYKLDWVQKRETWGQQLDANEGQGGLLLQDIETGIFGEIPEH